MKERGGESEGEKGRMERLEIFIYILHISLFLYVCFNLHLFLFIFYNIKLKGKRMNNVSLVCLVLSTSFLTNYFYYMLSPKTDWMLNHVNNKEQTQAWLLMYRDMQYNYHLGLVLGIIAVGVLAFAFRC
jgi:hypothetical protein